MGDLTPKLSYVLILLLCHLPGQLLQTAQEPALLLHQEGPQCLELCAHLLSLSCHLLLCQESRSWTGNGTSRRSIWRVASVIPLDRIPPTSLFSGQRLTYTYPPPTSSSLNIPTLSTQRLQHMLPYPLSQMCFLTNLEQQQTCHRTTLGYSCLIWKGGRIK